VVAELTGDDVNDARITEANLNAKGTRRTEAKAAPAKVGWLLTHSSSAYGPSAILFILSLLFAGVTQWLNPDFVSVFNIQNLAMLTTILALAGFAQLCVVLTGGIDLSVGPLAGLVVVLSSFLLTEEPVFGFLVGAGIILALCTLFGLLQGAIVEGLRLPPIVVTLATFTGLQGLSLILRPSPDGPIGDVFMEAVQLALGAFPLVLIATVVGTAVLEFVLLQRPIGRALRAMGSSPRSAGLVGLHRVRIGLLAFMASAILAGLAGLLLASQVGIGSANTGINYTLMSVTAVVLGGAKISGGRGSFVATFCAALFIQTIVSALPFLNLEAVWQYWIIGIATFSAAALFGQISREHPSH
jgi:ribose transport system ATP-binding protein